MQTGRKAKPEHWISYSESRQSRASRNAVHGAGGHAALLAQNRTLTDAHRAGVCHHQDSKHSS